MVGSSKKSPKGSGKKKRAIPKKKEPAGEGGSPSAVLPPHKHCFNCGISISSEKDICSDRCQGEWDRMLKKKKMMTYLPIFAILFLVLIYMIIVYG
jgi:predicted nucleic acid-binding Zn ribbon protein